MAQGPGPIRITIPGPTQITGLQYIQVKHEERKVNFKKIVADTKGSKSYYQASGDAVTPAQGFRPLWGIRRIPADRAKRERFKSS